MPVPKATFVAAPSVAGVTIVNPVPGAVSPDTIAAAVPPTFSFGPDFTQLTAALGSLVGDPVDAEGSIADGACDSQQLTTTGLAYVVCATGTVGFAAFPDGLHHFALTATGAVEWFGPSPDPPDGATAYVPPSAAATTTSCPTVGSDPSTACLLSDGANVLGYVTSTAGVNAYRFDLTDTEHVVALLTDLPDDYDLYLADGSGQIIGESVNEGTTPELIDMSLPPASYYLYVHVDPARDFNPDMPYRLELGLTPASADTASPAEVAPATAPPSG